MRLCTIFFLIVFILGGCVTGRQAEKADSFAQKLTVFRYSLYKDLKGLTMDELNSLMENGFSGRALGAKCAAFYDENRDQIRIYQRSILSKFTGTRLDLKDVVKDEHFDDILAKGPLSTFGLMERLIESGEMKEEGKRAYAVFKFMSIDPLRRVNFMIPMLISRLFSVKEMAALSLKNNLGTPLIAAQEIRPDYWEIIIDQYERVYFFDFDIKRDTLRLTKVGKRL
ncbi:MAG: hypothetical protein P8107_03450 [Spirochaetia bacterium]